MGNAVNGELYHTELITLLEEIWGEGWLSPGGREEVARLVVGIPVAGASVLDIGCGIGGVDIALVRDHGATHVTAVDVEDRVLSEARLRIEKAGLSDQIGFAKIAPGRLPFPPSTFDIVFSKDSIVHIPDKHALMQDIFRVLKPGGWFVASDWLIGHDGPPSAEMRAYIESEGLDFGMASPARYEDALIKAGFRDCRLESRNAWYRDLAKQELARLEGPIAKRLEGAVGLDFLHHNIQIWRNMLPVLETGEHCPNHLWGRKPGQP